MALVILGMAAAGVLLPFSSGAAAQAEGMHRTLAAKLAGDLMEQIVATPYGEIIAVWNGYTEDTGQMRDANREVFTDSMYAQFSRDVACGDSWPWPQQGIPPANFILVTVQVYHRGRLITTLSRLVSR
jgi:hypothetical protein